jgi:hypothetical protein
MTTKQLIKKIAQQLVNDGMTPENVFSEDIYEKVNLLLEKENFFFELEDEITEICMSEEKIKDRNFDYFGNKF